MFEMRCCLNYIGVELENPFGRDDNDLPLKHFQVRSALQYISGIKRPRSCEARGSRWYVKVLMIGSKADNSSASDMLCFGHPPKNKSLLRDYHIQQMLSGLRPC